MNVIILRLPPSPSLSGTVSFSSLPSTIFSTKHNLKNEVNEDNQLL